MYLSAVHCCLGAASLWMDAGAGVTAQGEAGPRGVSPLRQLRGDPREARVFAGVWCGDPRTP